MSNRYPYLVAHPTYTEAKAQRAELTQIIQTFTDELAAIPEGQVYTAERMALQRAISQLEEDLREFDATTLEQAAPSLSTLQLFTSLHQLTSNLATLTQEVVTLQSEIAEALKLVGVGAAANGPGASATFTAKTTQPVQRLNNIASTLSTLGKQLNSQIPGTLNLINEPTKP